jgi:hypothetical protein
MSDQLKPVEMVQKGEKRKGAGRPQRHVPEDQIRALRDQGLSFREIARKTGYGCGSVRRAYIASLKADKVQGTPAVMKSAP